MVTRTQVLILELSGEVLRDVFMVVAVVAR
jgi:hypothetical protein